MTLQRPSLGVLLSAIYILTLSHTKSSTRSNLDLNSYSILRPFLISTVLYLALKFHLFEGSGINLFAVNLSLVSVAFFLGTKLTVFKTYSFASGVALLIFSLGLLFGEEFQILRVSTDLSFLFVALASTFVLYKYKDSGISNIAKNLFRYPEATIFSYFIFFAIFGTILLELPLSRTALQRFSVLDSFFTSISAVCVTGLAVLDTATDFSLFGQSVILTLIQLGGFGIVAMSSWVLIGLQSSRMSVHQEQVLKELSGHKPSQEGMRSTLRKIFLYFFAFETLGTLILFQRFFQYDSDPSQAFWRALFTSISAFCNAGFALQSNSLVPYQSDVLVLFTTSLLIVAGGFAPLMAIGLPKKLWSGRLNLQEKLILTSTLGLLAAGFLFFLAVEWTYSLGGLDLFDKISNAWFQSVTTRTAGFNSVDYAEFASVTPFFFMILMFIGGNPGGTAGGIKTITFLMIMLTGIAGIRGESHLRVFNRHISPKGVFRTMAIFLVASSTVCFAFFMLTSTQNISVVSLLFETVSAVGTVGLSIGATAELDEIGKIIIIGCMLLGRVGPLALILLLFRNRSSRAWKVPKEDVYIA